MFTGIRRSYSGVWNIFQRYWSEYGGWRSLLVSPYFHLAVLLTFVLRNYWLNDTWWDVALTVLPNVIGFALGGYAIWLGFGDEKFRELISEKASPSDPSPYLEISAAFAHFIITQIISLICALIAKATNYTIPSNHYFKIVMKNISIDPDVIAIYIAPVGYGFGFLLLVYAIMTALAATLAVFRVTTWFDKFRNKIG